MVEWGRRRGPWSLVMVAAVLAVALLVVRDATAAGCVGKVLIDDATNGTFGDGPGCVTHCARWVFFFFFFISCSPTCHTPRHPLRSR